MNKIRKAWLREKNGDCFIGGPEDAPAHNVDTVYITHGYRCNYNNVGSILKSFFQLHHEWFNMWSHFAGFLVLVILICILAFSSGPSHTNTFDISAQNERDSSLFDKLPGFDYMEKIWKEKYDRRRDENLKSHEVYTNNLDSQLWSTISNVDNFVNKNTEDLSKEEITDFLNTIQFQVKEVGRTYKDFEEKLGASFVNFVSVKTINKTSHILEDKLNNLKKLVYSLDSQKYDWIDIYKYINIKAHTSAPNNQVHRWPIFVFLFSAAFCLGCSTIFHSCNCMQENVSKILRRIDYSGISILISGSVFPVAAYGFYCTPWIAFAYLSVLTTLSMIVFFLSLGEKFHSDSFRKWKGLIYGSLGITAATPGIHLLISDLLGGDILAVVATSPYYFAMGGCYLTGLFLYTKRIPERYVPGKVNNCGHSHNFWHIFTLIAVTLTYIGSFEVYYSRVEASCPV